MGKLQEYSEAEEEFKRLLVPPEEDRHLLTAAKWAGGYRWFRSTNVVCLEQYRRRSKAAKIGGSSAGLRI
jgi:hypothetical protein